jgi:hypothetical protein
MTYLWYLNSLLYSNSLLRYNFLNLDVIGIFNGINFMQSNLIFYYTMIQQRHGIFMSTPLKS